MSRRLVVVGDSMLDRDVEGTVERICPEAPVPVLDESDTRADPGGAARAAALAAGLGDSVSLITALGDDDAGRAVREQLDGLGVRVLDIGMDAATPEKIRLRCDGRTLLRLDRGGSHRPRLGAVGETQRRALAAASGVLVADYGRGVTSHAELRRVLAERAAAVPVVWDPHPRGREPVPGSALATPNRREAADLARDIRGTGMRGDAARAGELRRRWRARAVAVTMGCEGALLDCGRAVPSVLPAPFDAHGDPCGAGDCFAATAASALSGGADVEAAVSAAVLAATGYVAHGTPPTAAPKPRTGDRLEQARMLVERVRAEGGVVVATGGCFDLLHAGHVSTLEAARRLGDCLVVLLNSDRSVARLKGPQRPLVPQDDRARVLESLSCVDAVVVFDEPTPVAMLELLKPHVFAKGGDYSGAEIPETAVMRRFAGQTVILPTVQGRSTSRLIARAAERMPA
jgi:D-beta-D-heptose 7-phosphate kinase / D-beta-D-heptose 1-phosphate adenosyltransferase